MTLAINSNNTVKNATSFKGGASKSYVIKSEGAKKAIESMGGWSSPSNRFIMGVTALGTQPWIELQNKDVDKKTREMSCARICAKIIAGTTVGVIVRSLSIKSIKNFTRSPEELKTMASEGKKVSKWHTALIPSEMTPKAFAESGRFIKKHRSALGTIIGVLVGLFTNFALDAPITNFLTNVFVDKYVNKNGTHNPKNESLEAKGGK